MRILCALAHVRIGLFVSTFRHPAWRTFATENIQRNQPEAEAIPAVKGGGPSSPLRPGGSIASSPRRRKP